MSPKEKADQLVTVYYDSIMSFLTNNMKLENAKKCSLIAVDQIMLEQCKSSELKNPRYQDERLNYWNEVKQEIKSI